MSTRTLRQGWTAFVMVSALGVAALPVRGDPLPTTVPGAAPVGVRGSGSGFGRRDLASRDDPVLFPQRTVGSPRAGLPTFGAGPAPAAAEAPSLGAERGVGGPRLRSRIAASVQRAQASPPYRLQPATPKPCDAPCAVLTHGITGNGAADAAGLRKLVARVSGGFQLSPSKRVSLSPRVLRPRGKAMTGFSVRVTGV